MPCCGSQKCRASNSEGFEANFKRFSCIRGSCLRICAWVDQVWRLARGQGQQVAGSGRQIFEDFWHFHGQANFESDFRKSCPGAVQTGVVPDLSYAYYTHSTRSYASAQRPQWLVPRPWHWVRPPHSTGSQQRSSRASHSWQRLPIAAIQHRGGMRV